MASENYFNPTDDKQIIVVLEAPLGLYSSTQLKTIYELAESYELNVRATEDQRLSIELPKDLYETVASTFTENGLSTRPYLRGLHQPIACMGASCQYAQADVMHDSIRITETLADAMLTENKVRIGINGCSRSMFQSWRKRAPTKYLWAEGLLWYQRLPSF
jgi:dissimilatory sulfite reductase (desulfoviridin) alpha/beta subunit